MAVVFDSHWWLKFNRIQSLFYTLKCLRHREGGEQAQYEKNSDNEVCFKLTDVLEGDGETMQFQGTHSTSAIRQKHHQIAFATGRWRKLKIHMAVGFDQFTLTASTHYINRLISSKYLETVWLLTKPFPAEFLKKRIPWHIAYIVSITTNTDHIQVSWNKCCFFQEKGIWYKTFLRKSRQPQQKLTASIKICLNVNSTLSCKKYKQVSLYSDRYNPLKLSRDYALS